MTEQATIRCPACGFQAEVLEVSDQGNSFFDCPLCESSGWWGYDPGEGPSRTVICWRDGSERRTADVTVDGLAIPRVLECSPGPDGWLVAMQLDKNGRTMVADDGEIVTFVRRGNVEVEFK